MAVFTVHLKGLRFVSGHGVFEEEKVLQNEFEVNLALQLKAPTEMVTSLEQTINYADVYQLAKDVFSRPTPLLETVAMIMSEEIKKAFPALKAISVQIIKLQPPIAAMVGSVGVTYKKKYKAGDSKTA